MGFAGDETGGTASAASAPWCGRTLRLRRCRFVSGRAAFSRVPALRGGSDALVDLPVTKHRIVGSAGPSVAPVTKCAVRGARVGGQVAGRSRRRPADSSPAKRRGCDFGVACRIRPPMRARPNSSPAQRVGAPLARSSVGADRRLPARPIDFRHRRIGGGAHFGVPCRIRPPMRARPNSSPAQWVGERLAVRSAGRRQRACPAEAVAVATTERLASASATPSTLPESIVPRRACSQSPPAAGGARSAAGRRGGPAEPFRHRGKVDASLARPRGQARMAGSRRRRGGPPPRQPQRRGPAGGPRSAQRSTPAASKAASCSSL
jgi:hypothetical protein